MAESQPLRIVMAPKTKRAVALGLAVESYSTYENDGSSTALHSGFIVARAETFLRFLEKGEED